MQYLTQFMQQLYDYIFTLIGIDFTNYSGSLPSEFVNLYQYVEQFFQVLVIFYFVYMVFNFLFFVFSLGWVRK